MAKIMTRRMIFLTAIFFIGYVVFTQWGKIQSFQWNFQILYLLLSFAILMISLFFGPIGWKLVLKSLSQELSFKKSFYIWTTSSIAKYIPGTIWSYVNRASFAKEEKINIGPITASIYIEQILLVISSLVVGLPIIINTTSLGISPLYSFLAFAFLFFIIHPKFFYFLSYLPGKMGKTIGEINFLSIRSISYLYLFYTFHWIIFSIAFIFFINSFYPVTIEQYVLVGSALAASFFASFVFIIFPSGIGIRESILYLLLLESFPATVCLAIAVGSRLWLMLGELIAVLIAVYWAKESKL